MIGIDINKLSHLRAQEVVHYLNGNGDKGQECAMNAHHLETDIVARLNAFLASEGVTVSQIEGLRR